MELEEIDSILYRLERLTFTGRIMVDGTQALLVSLSTATDEMKVYYPELTSNQLKAILTKNNISVFTDLKSWDSYRGHGK